MGRKKKKKPKTEIIIRVSTCQSAGKWNHDRLSLGLMQVERGYNPQGIRDSERGIVLERWAGVYVGKSKNCQLYNALVELMVQSIQLGERCPRIVAGSEIAQPVFSWLASAIIDAQDRLEG